MKGAMKRAPGASLLLLLAATAALRLPSAAAAPPAVAAAPAATWGGSSGSSSSTGAGGAGETTTHTHGPDRPSGRRQQLPAWSRRLARTLLRASDGVGHLLVLQVSAACGRTDPPPPPPPPAVAPHGSSTAAGAAAPVAAASPERDNNGLASSPTPTVLTRGVRGAGAATATSAAPSAAGVAAASAVAAHDPPAEELCLWRYRSRRAASSGGGGSSSDGGSSRPQGTTPRGGVEGGSGAGAAVGPVAAGVVQRLRVPQDLSPLHALWPLEAVAFRAHVTALQLCAATATAAATAGSPAPGGDSGVENSSTSNSTSAPGTSSSTSSTSSSSTSSTSSTSSSSGGAVRLCAVVTDDAGWVAGREETLGGLEAALGHEGASAPAAIASAWQPSSATADGGGGGSSSSAGTVGPPRLRLERHAPAPAFHTFTWPQHGGKAGEGAHGSSPLIRHHHVPHGHWQQQQTHASTAAWLEATARGLQELLPRILHPAGSGARDGSSSRSFWVLPSCCAGWRVRAAAGNGSSSSVGSSSSRSSSARSSGGASSRMAGCVLLFTPQAAAGLLRLAGLDDSGGGGRGSGEGGSKQQGTPAPSTTQSPLQPSAPPPPPPERVPRVQPPPLLQLSGLGPAARSLLPAVTTPFYARLAQMARQGAVRLSVAAAPPPPTQTPLPPLSGPPSAPLRRLQPQSQLQPQPQSQPQPQPQPHRQQSQGPPRRLPRRRFLLFTSAGDQGAWRMWAAAPTANRSYDLLVAYYGSQMEVRHGRLHSGHDISGSSIDSGRTGGGGAAANTSNSSSGGRGGQPVFGSSSSSEGGSSSSAGPDFVYRSRGSKHQAVARLHALLPGLLQRYEAVAVWDDDLAASPGHIDAMFHHFADQLAGPRGSPGGVWVAQPSLRPGSKVDHVLAAHQPHLDLAYTSFVENNACVFRSDVLSALLDCGRYSGELLGWGVDYAYLHALGGGPGGGAGGGGGKGGEDGGEGGGAGQRQVPGVAAAVAEAVERRFAIMHRFQVLNPPAEAKPEGVREILKLASQEARQAQWRDYAARYGITPRPEVAHACVLSAEGAAALARGVPAAQVYPGYCPEAEAKQAAGM